MTGPGSQDSQYGCDPGNRMWQAVRPETNGEGIRWLQPAQRLMKAWLSF